MVSTEIMAFWDLIWFSCVGGRTCFLAPG